ncbi:MAG: zinc ribbon domain-containing protein [Ruminococcus sp.]|nr:zinc ribbon domain-containing protein [Ruminococcus sp.]
MGFFEGLGEKISNGASNLSNSAKKMAETTKINSEINANTNQIDKLMKSIGVAVKARLMDGITDEEVLQLSSEIDALVERNTALNDQLKELRGFSKCINCGKDLTADSLFCPYCGTKVEKPKSEEIAAEDVVVEAVNADGKKEKICPSCGFVETPDADFCSSCGARLDG